jgi:hypothetical protein
MTFFVIVLHKVSLLRERAAPWRPCRHSMYRRCSTAADVSQSRAAGEPLQPRATERGSQRNCISRSRSTSRFSNRASRANIVLLLVLRYRPDQGPPLFCSRRVAIARVTHTRSYRASHGELCLCPYRPPPEGSRSESMPQLHVQEQARCCSIRFGARQPQENFHLYGTPPQSRLGLVCLMVPGASIMLQQSKRHWNLQCSSGV